MRDNIWIFGYDSYTNDSIFGGTVFDFRFNPLEINYESRPMNIRITDASICDEAGNLLFYTNGIYVANRSHEQMLNGGGLSPGGMTGEYENYGMIMPQGALALPIPESGNKFVLLHTLLDYFPGIGFGGSKVYYS